MWLYSNVSFAALAGEDVTALKAILFNYEIIFQGCAIGDESGTRGCVTLRLCFDPTFVLLPSERFRVRAAVSFQLEYRRYFLLHQPKCHWVSSLFVQTWFPPVIPA